MLNKYKKKLKELALYTSFRKLRYILHLTPSFRAVRNFTVHYLGGLYNRIDNHHVFLFGGGLAFSIFVCIVPFVLIMFAVLGNLLDSTYMQFQISTLIETVIPYYQYAEFVKEIIFTRITEVIEYKTVAGIVGGFGLFFAASGLFSSMRTILNTVFGLQEEEHFILAKLKDFALVLLAIVTFFSTTIVMPALDILRQSANQFESLEFLQSGIFEHFIFSALSLFLIFILFFILYIIVPKRKIGKKASAVGALWAAILWEAAKQLFGYYIYNFGTLGKIYGTYALIVVVAFWIYYSSIVFIIGAEIGRLYADRRYAKMKGKELIPE
jgi:membrane protein